MIAHNYFYEGKVRTRVCGLCIKNEQLLLVKHNLNGKVLYAPPGGAVEFGESLQAALKREIKEETGLRVHSAEFRFITEYVNPPLHAIELYFNITSMSGNTSTGTDPEANNQPIITDVAWLSLSEIKQIPTSQLHHILHNCTHLSHLPGLTGFVPLTPH